MTRQFDEEDAQRYGVDGAVVLWHIRYIQNDNEANGRYFRDGCYWVKESITGFAEQFSFYTEQQLRRILKNLEDDKALKRLGGPGFSNDNVLDRASWYSVVPFVGTDKSTISIIDSRIEEIVHLSELTNGWIDTYYRYMKGSPSREDITYVREYWKQLAPLQPFLHRVKDVWNDMDIGVQDKCKVKKIAAFVRYGVMQHFYEKLEDWLILEKSYMRPNKELIEKYKAALKEATK